MDETALKVPDAVQPIAATVNLRGVVRRRWDVVVIGAGPAGAVAARQLALRRFDVLLVDKSQFPRDKVCGCCVNAAAITALRRAGLGAHFDRTGGRPWRKMPAHRVPQSTSPRAWHYHGGGSTPCWSARQWIPGFNSFPGHGQHSHRRAAVRV